MPFRFEFRQEAESAKEYNLDLLKQFFFQLEKFLKQVCLEQRFKNHPLFPEDLNTRAYLPEMFAESQSDFAFVSEYLRTNSDFIYAPLNRAGLTGASLRGKLMVLEHWSRVLDRSAGNQIKKFLGKVLSSINTLLGSFVTATKVGELIKELKETIENTIAPD